MLTCEQMTALVTDYVEGRLRLTERAKFKLHILMCKHCREYLAQMRKIQVRSDERSSNPCSEASTRAQVSCATSSAAARSRTKSIATRSRVPWWLETSSRNAASSRARSRATSALSSARPDAWDAAGAGELAVCLTDGMRAACITQMLVIRHGATTRRSLDRAPEETQA